jgi:hypothetical protein
MLRLVNNGTISCSITNFKIAFKCTFFGKSTRKVIQSLILFMPSCLILLLSVVGYYLSLWSHSTTWIAAGVWTRVVWNVMLNYKEKT